MMSSKTQSNSRLRRKRQTQNLLRRAYLPVVAILKAFIGKPYTTAIQVAFNDPITKEAGFEEVAQHVHNTLRIVFCLYSKPG
jgi:hypothetical protein